MVNRYDIENFDEHADCVADGEYVKYDDYASLESLNRELVELIEDAYPMINRLLPKAKPASTLKLRIRNLLTKLKEAQ